jgi:hypothetical protein
MNHAADDFEFIRARLAEIRLEETPRCPRAPSKTLHDCLREQGRCPEDCQHHTDWIGPQP